MKRPGATREKPKVILGVWSLFFELAPKFD